MLARICNACGITIDDTQVRYSVKFDIIIPPNVTPGTEFAQFPNGDLCFEDAAKLSSKLKRKVVEVTSEVETL